jgi:8-oxo-dGTP pyrophosphatase MutT (NUDIX family)
MTNKKESAAPAPVPASTILLVRDSKTHSGFEVFMVVRHHQIDFASGALVFPGGKIDPGDRLVRDRCPNTEDLSDEVLALQVGAIREVFEECGVLLARAPETNQLISGERLEGLEPYRDRLNANEITMAMFLEQEDLYLACDLLVPFSHWTTPTMMPKRFDTWFYIVEAPADHTAIHDGHESVDSVWISPNDALEGGANGKYTIIFPTRLNIEMLAKSGTADEAIAASKSRVIVEVLPWTEKRDDGTYLCIQPEAGYDISEEKMPERKPK